MRLRWLLAAMVVVVLVGLAPEASGGGGTPITSCGQVVTTSAFLTQDLFCPGSTGVVVGASGITIDLKGFTLRGDRTVVTFGIDASGGHDDVTIRNGVIRNFTNGIEANPGADGFSALNVILSGNGL